MKLHFLLNKKKKFYPISGDLKFFFIELPVFFIDSCFAYDFPVAVMNAIGAKPNGEIGIEHRGQDIGIGSPGYILRHRSCENDRLIRLGGVELKKIIKSYRKKHFFYRFYKLFQNRKFGQTQGTNLCFHRLSPTDDRWLRQCNWVPNAWRSSDECGTEFGWSVCCSTLQERELLKKKKNIFNYLSIF